MITKATKIDQECVGRNEIHCLVSFVFFAVFVISRA